MTCIAWPDQPVPPNRSGGAITPSSIDIPWASASHTLAAVTPLLKIKPGSRITILQTAQVQAGRRANMLVRALHIMVLGYVSSLAWRHTAPRHTCPRRRDRVCCYARSGLSSQTQAHFQPTSTAAVDVAVKTAGASSGANGGRVARLTLHLRGPEPMQRPAYAHGQVNLARFFIEHLTPTSNWR